MKRSKETARMHYQALWIAGKCVSVLRFAGPYLSLRLTICMFAETVQKRKEMLHVWNKGHLVFLMQYSNREYLLYFMGTMCSGIVRIF